MKNIFMIIKDWSFVFKFCKLHPVGIYFLKVNNGNTRTRCEMCSKLTINTPEWRQWHLSGVFIVNFEHVNANWVAILYKKFNIFMFIFFKF